MPDVVTAGETMATLRADGQLTGGPASVSVAGSEGNVAIGLARLGHAARWVGAVGDDALGRLITRTYAAEGIDVGHVRVDPDAPTGILVSEQRLPGIARVDYHRTGSAGGRIRPDDLTSALADTPRVLHLSGITPALSAEAAEAVRAGAAEARRRGTMVSFDVNYRSRLWDAGTARGVLAPLLDVVDILVADSAELAVIVSDSGGSAAAGPDADDARAAALLDRGVGEVVLKQGADGATTYLSGGAIHAPARRVQAVDAIGAGDAFVAGYLSGMLDGLDVAGRLARANTLGAFAVASRGDWEGLPRRAELPLLDQAEGAVVR